MTTMKRLIGVSATFFLSVLLLLACTGQAYAAEGGLELTGLDGDCISGSLADGYSLYVRDGDEVEFTLSMANATDGELRYVNMSESSAYTGNDGQEVNHFAFPGKAYRESYESLTAAATNAVWDQGAELITNYEGLVYNGYTIEAGATATVKMGFDAGNLQTGEYQLSFKLGKECEFYNAVLYSDGQRFWEPTGQISVVDEYLTVPITVVVYAQDGAKLSVGPGSPSNVTPISEDENTPYDIGTFSLSGSGISGSKTVYVVNTSEASQAPGQPDATSTIHATLALDAPDSEETPFTSAYVQPQGQDLAVGENMSFDIAYDATNYIAGTYKGYLVVTTVPRSVSVNGGEASASGVYRFPIQLTLTGEKNPNLDARVTDLAAQAGNGLVELSWTPAEGSYAYEVYRREGAEMQTNPDQLDWSQYQPIGKVYVNGNETLRFADGTAQNGTTYSYTVLTGGPHRGYAATPVSATPSATATLKILPPMDGAYSNYVAATDQEGGVYVYWNMNVAYGGESCDGAGIVDHFNVYRDGVLVRQVYQNKVERKSEDAQGDSYEWSTFIEVPEPYVDYTWNVSAVSATGVEGPRSGDAPEGERANVAHSYLIDRPVIVGHEAEYYTDDGLSLWIDHYIGQNHYGATLSFWRQEGTSAPNTATNPVATVQSKMDTYSSSRDPDYTDNGVAANKTYTYTVRASDSAHHASEDYTFTVYTKNDRYYSTDVRWSVVDGTKPTLKFYVPDSGAVARVYRNNTLKKTINYNNGAYQTYTDEPTEDGTYTYRVDFYYSNGNTTTTGRTFTFVRNSNAEADMLAPPDAPTLTGRLSDRNVVLSWTPAETGGAPDGWYVYRRDAGQFVNGMYKEQQGWYGTWVQIEWGNDRYLVIKDASKQTLVDTYSSSNFNGVDTTEGILSGISWSTEKNPHEWWVCAYNEAGVSAPSRVVTYSSLGVDDYNSPILPANEDSFAPGMPVIDDVWVDWEDDSRPSQWDTVIGGYVRVAWKDPNPGGGIDQWNVGVKGTVYHQNEAVINTLSYGDALLSPNLKRGGSEFDGASVNALPQSNSSGDYERTVEVSVSAQNSWGASAADTASVVVRSLPRFCVLPSNEAAVLRWTDLFQDSATVVNGWEIWRKAPYGVWMKVDAPSNFEYANAGSDGAEKYYQYADEGLLNGYDYEYKVVAKCADGVDRPSVVRTVKPLRTAAAEAPGAPSNLQATKVNGQIALSWDAPENGDAPGYYQIMYKRGSDGPWTFDQEVTGSSTSAVSHVNEMGDYQFFVWAYSYIDNQRTPDYPDEPQNYRAYTTASNITDPVTLTSDDISQQATAKPGSFTLAAVPGDHQVTLNWSASSGATYYVVTRINYDYPLMPDVTVAATTRTFTDVDALPGVRYLYRVTAYNNKGGAYYEVYAVATGTTADELAATTVEDLINALPAPESVTVDDIDRIMEVQAAWAGLSQTQKSLVDEALAQKLADCVSAAEELQLRARYSELVAPVQQLIDALPDAADVAASDADAIHAVRAAYDAIQPAEAKGIVRDARLLEAEEALAVIVDREAANEVASLVSNLPEPDSLTLDDKTAVESARAAYDELTESQLSYLPENCEATLIACETRIAALEKEAADEALAQEAMTAIAGLPAVDNLGLSDRAAVEAARAAYDALSDEAKARVQNYDVLLAAEARIAALQREADEQAAAQVDVAINDLGDVDSLTLADRTRVEAARAEYDALSAAAKQYVTKLSMLEAAEAKINDLVADEQAELDAAGIITLIDQIGEVTLESEDAILAARQAYDEATERAQGKIPSEKLDVLESAELQLQQLKDAAAAERVIQMINDLPDEDSLTLADRDAINEALTAYNQLTDAQKALVGAGLLTQLNNADSRVMELEIEAAEAARIDIAIGAVTLSGQTFTYDGKAKRPSAKLVVGGTTLVAENDFKVSYTNNVNAGTGKVTLTGIGAYKGSIGKTFTIKKAGNKLAAKGKTGTVKASKVKKKAQSLKVAKVVQFTKKGVGTLSYKKKSGNKKIVINKKTGKVTVKKGLKKGTYKVKVAIRAAGNGNYNAKTINVAFKVKVK